MRLQLATKMKECTPFISDIVCFVMLARFMHPFCFTKDSGFSLLFRVSPFSYKEQTVTSKRVLWLGAALMGCTIAAQAIAQTPVREVPARENVQTTASQARRAKTLLGSKVHIQGDLSIGVVDDIVFNDDGYIDYLVVVNEGKLVAVPWQAAKFNFEQRVATINITQDRFREIPTFTVQAYPNFYEPAYRTKIYTYYGLTPREERRIDRRTRP